MTNGECVCYAYYENNICGDSEKRNENKNTKKHLKCSIISSKKSIHDWI